MEKAVKITGLKTNSRASKSVGRRLNDEAREKVLCCEIQPGPASPFFTPQKDEIWGSVALGKYIGRVEGVFLLPLPTKEFY